MIRGIPWSPIIFAIIAGIATYYFATMVGSNVHEAFSLGFITGFLYFFLGMTRYYLGLTYNFRCSNYVESVFARGAYVQCDRSKFPHKNHRNKRAEELARLYGTYDANPYIPGDEK